MSKITPFIRCENNANQLTQTYLSIFPESKICESNPIVTTIEVFGQTNGGQHSWWVRNPSISFSLRIKDYDLTKKLWDKLIQWGQIMMDFADYPWSKWYGRCNDSHGTSWQVMFDDRESTSINQIIPSFMFVQHNTGKAQEAMEFYCSVFPNSTIDFTRAYGENTMWENPIHLSHAEFKLHGQQFIALDSGANHAFNFNDGVSLMIACDGQEEVDYYRDKLITDGGSEVQCGWCKDKYGVSRQVIPIQLQQALSNPDQHKAQYAMQTMMNMKKIIIDELYQR